MALQDLLSYKGFLDCVSISTDMPYPSRKEAGKVDKSARSGQILKHFFVFFCISEPFDEKYFVAGEICLKDFIKGYESENNETTEW